jgi:hypothetical protein
MITWGNTYWPAFLIISGAWVLSGFGIPGTIALATQPGTHLDNTLSQYARVQLHAAVAMGPTTMHTWAWWLSFAVWMLFVLFITAHIWFLQFG